MVRWEQAYPLGSKGAEIQLRAEEGDLQAIAGVGVTVRLRNAMDHSFESQAAHVVGHLGGGVRVPKQRVDLGAEVAIAEAEPGRVLIDDRDTKWSGPVRECLREAGIRIVQTPYQAPNPNAYAERFVRSIREECLDRIIPLGGHHFRRAVREHVAHYHLEQNHQALGNTLIAGAPARSIGSSRRRPRLGGFLNHYERAA